jgi:mannose-6-phosphate isomerase-like protein (cupin superfamily)
MSLPIKSAYAEVAAFTTKDGSQIRELMHPLTHGNGAQSVAEALIEPGQKTRLHRHHVSEEIYHITQGSGSMWLDEATFKVYTGDTICIPPGSAHQIACEGEIVLKVLCFCTPAYAHEDTELI